jgi:rod shape-determining protein MreC
LLAYQIKNDSDVRIIRVWAVTAITPIANVAETTRSTVYGLFHNYFILRDAGDQNRRMRAELNALKLENQFLKTELATADRVKALAQFEKRTPSKLLAARIIGTATTSSTKIVFLDRGSTAGVQKGMAVITPDGIVGKVVASYPTASQALLATDPGFAAGVVSQKSKVRGILRGVGSGKCKVDQVQNEEKLEVGEMFFTSGDDRIFPRGLPVGRADVVHEGPQFKDILVYPSGLQNGVEEVLIVIEGVHELVPDAAEADTSMYLGAPAPTVAAPAAQGVAVEAGRRPAGTEADRLRDKYRDIGEAQGHKFGEGNAPNFNVQTPPKPKAPPTTPKPTVMPVVGTTTPTQPPAQ